VLPGRTVGTWAVLGAGAVAITSLEADRTYVGVPARATVTRTAGPQRTGARRG
jgi:acetyltransferase-like isoleucine patch superfamily enzyme